MDHFGIGAGLVGASHIYFQSGRRTGRTTSLVESLKDGDRVVCAGRREAMHLDILCRERGLKVECIVIDPSRPREIFQRSTSEGRTLFDHSWVEQYYLNAIERCGKELDHFQRESSGFGTAHFETRRRAEEIAKWRV
jgi:hypothetical protein